MYKKRKEEDNAYLKELKYELKEIRKQLDQITEAVVNGLYNISINEKSQKLENKRKEIEETIYKIESSNLQDIITEDEVKNLLNYDLKDFDKLSVEYKRTLYKNG